MTKLNKVITTFQQDFISAEKAHARANIGAAAAGSGASFCSPSSPALLP